MQSLFLERENQNSPSETLEIKQKSVMENFNLISTLLILALLFHCSSMEGQTCAADRNCNSGLHCEACIANGNVRPRCTCIQPLSPASKVKGLLVTDDAQGVC